MTWKDVAAKYPEFVQWIVQTHGPLPDGAVKQEQFDELTDQYRHYLGG